MTLMTRLRFHAQVKLTSAPRKSTAPIPSARRMGRRLMGVGIEHARWPQGKGGAKREAGRDGALRRPRAVQARNVWSRGRVLAPFVPPAERGRGQRAVPTHFGATAPAEFGLSRNHAVHLWSVPRRTRRGRRKAASWDRKYFHQTVNRPSSLDLSFPSQTSPPSRDIFPDPTASFRLRCGAGAVSAGEGRGDAPQTKSQ